MRKIKYNIRPTTDSYKLDVVVKITAIIWFAVEMGQKIYQWFF